MNRRQFLNAGALLSLTLANRRTLAAPGDDAEFTDNAFMTGLFSLLEVLINLPTKEIIKEIPIHDAAADALINHGRAPDAQGRASLGRARYTDASRYLLRRGFVVAVPTRVGYGVSGGEDVEDTGACNNRNYPPGFDAAAVQMLAALNAVRQRPDVADRKSVV